MKDLSIQIKDLKKSVASLIKQIAIKEKKAEDLQKEKDDELDFKKQTASFYSACSQADYFGRDVFDQFSVWKNDFAEGKISAAKFKALLKPLDDLIYSFDCGNIHLNDFNLNEIKIGLEMAGYKL
jgi:hypothetical protein